MTEEEKKAAGGKNEAVAAASGKEVSQMKPGDYTIHLLIQKAKDLNISEEGTINVIVEVEVQGKKEISKEIKEVSATTVCNFGSHIFFELFKQSVAQLEATKIIIRLKEKGFFKDELIGQIELDLTYLYNLEERTQEHKWVALINPEDEDFSSVAAYLKTSASVYGVDDNPKELKVDEGEDDDNCIMPASIKPKYTQLKMHIVRGQHLPRLDRGFAGAGPPTKMDAFVVANIGNKKLKTSVQITKEDACVWNETFLIPIRIPIMSGKLVLDVMDLDGINDEQAGTLVFDYKDLLQLPQKSFFWANIYGAPGGEDFVQTNKNVADEMNKDPNMATMWKGRILIGIEFDEDVEGPKCGKEAMSTAPPSDANGKPIPGARSIVELAEEYMMPKEYLLMYEFGTINNIPEKSGGFNLRLKIAEHTWDSKNGSKRAKGYNYNRWSQRSEQIKISLPYGSVDEMDDIFLYVCPDDRSGIGNIAGNILSFASGGQQEDREVPIGKPISYIRLKAADFKDPNPKMKWVEMITEPVENQIKSPELAGVVSFRLSIVRADSGVHLPTQDNWMKKLQRRPKSSKVRCYLFQCRNLPAADDDGASDPIITIFNTINLEGGEDRMKSQVKETQKIENNCDPMFYEVIELTIDYFDGEEFPPFIFDVYDVDKAFITKDTRDYLGRAVIQLKDSSYKTVDEMSDSIDLKPDIPKWHPIRYAAGMPVSGEILVSFLFCAQDDHTWKKQTKDVVMMGMYDDSAVVRFDDFKVELNVLGLRNLQSAGLLPVKKAYIDFLLKSMVPPMAASALEVISTQPGPTGPDPTINSVIEFQIPMPLDRLYAPSMACRVYDKVFKGFSGQLIGSFIIPIGEIMKSQQDEYDESAKKLDNVIQELEKILLKEPVVKDYNSMNKANDDQLLKDKSFRETQQKEKELYNQVMKKDVEEEKKTFSQKITEKIADKIIAPEPVKPTTALQRKIQASNKNALTRRLIAHTDEDSDSDGETYTNKVAKQDTEKMKYVPPQIIIPSINESQRFDMDALAATPRSQLSNSQRQALDREAILDVISQKSDPEKLKLVAPKEGEKFIPPTPTKITKQDVENAIKTRSGANTPASKSSLRSFNSAKTGMSKALIQMNKEEQASISRQVEDERKIAQKAWNEKNGKPMIALTFPAKYKRDDRLNCYREIDKPPSVLFEELGWDRDPENPKEKHYRKFFPMELEQCKDVMSKPSEFECYQLKRGQTRGASKSFSLFGGNKDQATGEEDTTQIMGIFKALITVTHRNTAQEKQRHMMLKLTKIRHLLGEIYQKQFKKEFPLPQNFFCDQVTELAAAKTMTKQQRERGYSDDIKVPAQNMINTGETFSSKTKKAQDTSKSKRSFKFEGLESTVLNAEGRTKFKDLIRTMGLMHLQILKKVVDVQSDQIVKRLLMVEMRCNVRVYIVRAFNLAARDNDSPSDPYVKVILGENEHNDRENWQLDEPKPDIYKKFDFQAVFPGCPLLKIQFWDYDLLFGDDFIGETIVDVEDRYFSTDFKSYSHKPIEHRQLHHPNTEMSQGTVVTWIEINETNAKDEVAPEYDISKKPEEDFEVRVIIWDTEELKMMDGEGTTDGFVRVFFESEASKDTDTHFRNSDGKCSWNYRLLFPFRNPAKNNNYKLTLQAYDLDLFKSNDLIGIKVIDLKDVIQDSELAKRPISLTKDYYDEFLVPEGKMKAGDLTFERDDSRQFWVNLESKLDGKPVINGRLKISVEVYPKRDAEANPVGSGQSEPNVNPFLPKPFGRIEFSINPLKMLSQLVGPALRRKLYCYCCIILCCALCIMMAPMIFSQILVNIFTPG